MEGWLLVNIVKLHSSYCILQSRMYSSKGIPTYHAKATVLEGWSGSSDERELWRKCPNNIHLHYNVIVYTWLKWPEEVCCYPSLTFLLMRLIQ